MRGRGRRSGGSRMRCASRLMRWGAAGALSCSCSALFCWTRLIPKVPKFNVTDRNFWKVSIVVCCSPVVSFGSRRSLALDHKVGSRQKESSLNSNHATRVDPSLSHFKPLPLHCSGPRCPSGSRSTRFPEPRAKAHPRWTCPSPRPSTRTRTS